RCLSSTTKDSAEGGLGGASPRISRVLGRTLGLAAVDLIASNNHLYWLKLRWDE
ncbi:hypothetical protein B9Z19DRAFT_892438, partial [Tuber borchii]